MAPRYRILWLVAQHIVVGLAGAVVASFAGRSPSLRGAGFIGLVLGQTSLLAIWGGFGGNVWWSRLIGVAVGIVYLFPLLGVGISELNRLTLFVVVVATMLTVLVLLAVRFFGVVIRPSLSSPSPAARIQFSVRHLMILTLVIACLITIGKSVHPYLPHENILLRLLLFAVTGVVVGIVPVWFILATRRPVLYGIGLVATVACVGYCAGSFDGRLSAVFWTALMVTEAIGVVISLLAVRSIG